MPEGQPETAAAAAESVEPLPTIVERAMQAMYDSRSGVQDLADIIGLDPALTGRLLKLVNSAYYRTLSRPVVSLAEAILRVGYRSVRSALLTMATENVFNPHLPRYGLKKGQFWHHSLTVALSAREVSLRVYRSQRDLAEEAYVAGLLHDIGKVGMDRQLVADMSEVRRLVREEGLSYYDAEMAELGFTHSQVSEMVGTRWRLPPATTEAIGAHHRPEGVSSTLPAIVATADAAAWIMGFPGAGGQDLQSLGGTALARLGLTTIDLENLMAGIIPVVREAVGLLSAERAPAIRQKREKSRPE